MFHDCNDINLQYPNKSTYDGTTVTTTLDFIKLLYPLLSKNKYNNKCQLLLYQVRRGRILTYTRCVLVFLALLCVSVCERRRRRRRRKRFFFIIVVRGLDVLPTAFFLFLFCNNNK